MWYYVWKNPLYVSTFTTILCSVDITPIRSHCTIKTNYTTWMLYCIAQDTLNNNNLYLYSANLCRSTLQSRGSMYRQNQTLHSNKLLNRSKQEAWGPCSYELTLFWHTLDQWGPMDTFAVCTRNFRTELGKHNINISFIDETILIC